MSVKGIDAHKQYIINHRTDEKGDTERRCSKCGEWKEETLDNFYMKNKKKPEMGFTSACRECTKVKSNKYREEHWQEHSDSFKQWRADHLDYMTDYNKQWRQDHHDHKREYELDYYKNNPEKFKVYTKNHRIHDITKTEQEAILKVFHYQCAYCGMTLEEHRKKYRERLHNDHVDESGANDLSNDVPACKSCNSQKHQFDMETWFREQDFFDEERLLFIYWWIDEGYKNYIEDKLPYKIIRKQNEGQKTFHHELWTVDEMRNFIECLAISVKKKDLIKDIQIFTENNPKNL